MIDGIARCEEKYHVRFEEAARLGDVREQETQLLEALDGYLPELVESFDVDVPPPRERAGRLALVGEYYAWRRTTGTVEARRRALILSYLATETECQGAFRLGSAHLVKVAAHYDAMGAEFFALKLYVHAATCYQKAADYYMVLSDHARRDKCLLRQHQARHRARPYNLVRALETASEITCGYGYRPFLLLGWMGGVLAVFCLLVWMFGGIGFGTAVEGSFINFLNPLGLGDVNGFGVAAKTLFIIESYVGIAAMQVFFVLLVRFLFHM